MNGLRPRTSNRVFQWEPAYRLLLLLTIAAIPAGSAFGQPETTDESPVVEPESGKTPVPPYTLLEYGGKPVLWSPSQVGEFELVDQLGRPVTRETLRGKPWVANFIFARCAYQCPMNCRKIMELNQELKDVDVRFVTITVDPEHDTVEIMREFSEIWQADPERWLFCTGEPDAVWNLIRKGFMESAWEGVGTDAMPGMEFAHSNYLVHVDAEGKVIGRYNSVVDPELVTLKRVLQGKIETPAAHRPFRPEPVAAVDPWEKLPAWAQRLPATNAMLNGLAGMLLLWGYAAIKVKLIRLHKQLMLTAFFVSVLFLASYVTYHVALHEYTGTHGKPYAGPENLRTIYYGILISHVVLAAAVPILAIITIRNGLAARWDRHRVWAWWTFPIWLYVSVTGVMIYVMLYRMG